MTTGDRGPGQQLPAMKPPLPVISRRRTCQSITEEPFLYVHTIVHNTHYGSRGSAQLLFSARHPPPGSRGSRCVLAVLAFAPIPTETERRERRLICSLPICDFYRTHIAMLTTRHSVRPFAMSLHGFLGWVVFLLFSFSHPLPCWREKVRRAEPRGHHSTGRSTHCPL